MLLGVFLVDLDSNKLDKLEDLVLGHPEEQFGDALGWGELLGQIELNSSRFLGFYFLLLLDQGLLLLWFVAGLFLDFGLWLLFVVVKRFVERVRFWNQQHQFIIDWQLPLFNHNPITYLCTTLFILVQVNTTNQRQFPFLPFTYLQRPISRNAFCLYFINTVLQLWLPQELKLFLKADVGDPLVMGCFVEGCALVLQVYL